MKLEGIQKATVTRITSSLAGKINPDAKFSHEDLSSRKLEMIFENFDIEPEFQGGIFVACNGKGDINKQLQNTATSFLAAEQILLINIPLEADSVLSDANWD